MLPPLTANPLMSPSIRKELADWPCARRYICQAREQSLRNLRPLKSEQGPFPGHL